MTQEKFNEQFNIERSVKLDFEVRAHQGEEDEMISCFIPATNSYFSAKSWDDVEKKANAMIKSFIHFWDKYNHNGEQKDFSHMRKDPVA